MSKKQIVAQYLEGFRNADQEKILACLSENVVWRLHGCQTFNGKSAFAANIRNDEFCEIPLFEIREFIEEGNKVVAVGSGALDETSGIRRTFVFCEVFLFDGQLIREVDTFHVWTSPAN